ncbi:MAG TPA: mechanosensitive ion channel domain-containing protein [Chthoniobacterales bacterium]|jgi:small-conductance mechanosensitive channel
MVTLIHLLILSLVLFGLWQGHRYLAARLARSHIHCPTQLAAKGQFEAPPRGWVAFCLAAQLMVSRLILVTASIGIYFVLLYDFGLRSIVSNWFSRPGWEWRLPVVLTIGASINLIITFGRLHSRRLREEALKDLEHSRAILVLTGAQALEALLPLLFVFLVISMLGLPSQVQALIERSTLVLVIILVGINTLRTLGLVEAKIVNRAKLKYGGEERQIRAAQTQYSVLHRILNVLVILATLGAAFMVFDEVRSFGASLLTSAGIVGLVAGVAAQRTLQNVFAGLQLAITQPIALGDVIEVENVVGTIEEITFSFVSVRLRDLRRLILPVTYFLERPFTNWTRTSAESLASFSLVLALDASLSSIRRQVDTILQANPLWKGGKSEVLISELGESSITVRITVGGPNPEVAFQIRAQVQEHLLDYLNRFKKGSLIGAVAEPKPAVDSPATPPPNVVAATTAS